MPPSAHSVVVPQVCTEDSSVIPRARGKRSKTAEARRALLKKDRKRGAVLLQAAASVMPPSDLRAGVHSPRVKRALDVAFARGAAAERAAAKERRGAKRVEKKASTKRGKAAKRAARRRRAAGY